MELPTLVAQLRLSEFIEVLELAQDNKSIKPYYQLPAREAVIVMMTGRGNESITLNDNFYPLKLFNDSGEEFPIDSQSLHLDDPILTQLWVKLEEIVLVYEEHGCGCFPWLDSNREFVHYPTGSYAKQYKKPVYIACEDAIGILRHKFPSLSNRELSLWLSSENTLTVKNSPYASAKTINYSNELGKYAQNSAKPHLDDFLYRWYFSKQEVEVFQPSRRYHEYRILLGLAPRYGLSEAALNRIIWREVGQFELESWNPLPWVDDSTLEETIKNALYPDAVLPLIFKGFDAGKTAALPQEPEEISFSAGNLSVFNAELEAKTAKSPPVLSLPLTEFIKCLEYYHDPKRLQPYYRLPAREGIYFMLTGQGSRYAMDWREKYGPSQNFRLMLFDDTGSTALFDPKQLIEGGILPEGLHVRLNNVALLFLTKHNGANGFYFVSIPWQGEDGQPMKVHDGDKYAKPDYIEYVKASCAKVINACSDEFLWSYEKTVRAMAKDKSESDPVESRVLSNLANHLKDIYLQHPGLDALLGFEDYLKEQIENFRRKDDDTRREVCENALVGLHKMAEEDRGKDVFIEEWQQKREEIDKTKEAQRLAGNDTLGLLDVLFLFNVKTPQAFSEKLGHGYYAIDDQGISEKKLTGEEEARLMENDGDLWRMWTQIRQDHKLAFPCTAGALVDWCNRLDVAGNSLDFFGNHWESLLPSVFVEIVKAGRNQTDKIEGEKIKTSQQANPQKPGKQSLPDGQDEANGDQIIKKYALIKRLRPYLEDGTNLDSLLSNASKNEALSACKSPNGRGWKWLCILKFLANNGYLKEEAMSFLVKAGLEQISQIPKS